jgi:hypothetical protein
MRIDFGAIWRKIVGGGRSPSGTRVTTPLPPPVVASGRNQITLPDPPPADAAKPEFATPAIGAANPSKAPDDAHRLADYCRRLLPLEGSELGDEFAYSSSALCVIDTVWSIGVRYEGVKNVIRRYCHYLGTTQEECSVPLSALIEDMDSRGIQFYLDHDFQNRQRTSTRGGILKVEAVYRYAAVLKKHGIDDVSDVAKVLPNPEVERDLSTIPGHGSGIAFKYFLMLTGSYNQVKPDRMILRFVSSALGRAVSIPEAERLIAEATTLLKRDHPHLEARLIDNLIWKYQRTVLE